MGTGVHFSIFTEDHTIKHFRGEHWVPALLDRKNCKQWVDEGKKSMKNRLREKSTPDY